MCLKIHGLLRIWIEFGFRNSLDPDPVKLLDPDSLNPDPKHWCNVYYFFVQLTLPLVSAYVCAVLWIRIRIRSGFNGVPGPPDQGGQN
jgi:hypothetical protein